MKAITCTICGYTRWGDGDICPLSYIDEPSPLSPSRHGWQAHKNHAMTQAVESVASRGPSSADEFTDLLDMFIHYRMTQPDQTYGARVELSKRLILAVGKALSTPYQAVRKVSLREEDMNPLMKGEQEPMTATECESPRIVFSAADFDCIRRAFARPVSQEEQFLIVSAIQFWLDAKVNR